MSSDASSMADRRPCVSQSVATRPEVSVAMITYNHERFITQAVESVMAQRTDFPIELVIGEDCSTDGTREIVLALQQKYPDRIRLLLPEANLGMMHNFVQTICACTGKYIALLEGDDYWTDPAKLQRQVDLLEEHAEYSACFTRARHVFEDSPERVSFVPGNDPERRCYTTEELLRKNHIATASVVYRGFIREIDFGPFLSLGQGDWPLHVLASLRGPIGYLNDVMAAYRLHAGGVWTASHEATKFQVRVATCRMLARALPPRYSDAVRAEIAKAHQLTALTLLRRGNRLRSAGYALRSAAAIPLARSLTHRWYVKRAAILLLGALTLPVRTVERLLR